MAEGVKYLLRSNQDKKKLLLSLYSFRKLTKGVGIHLCKDFSITIWPERSERRAIKHGYYPVRLNYLFRFN